MTPEQIDAVLPRVPAGIPALTGDLTDDEERAVAIRWLLEFYREAEHAKPVHLHFGADPYCDECRPSDGGGIDWTPRSPDSPPEAPESDETTSEVPGVRRNDSGETTAVSAPWPPPYGPAPGITYWEAK